ncbi:MAG: pyridoxal-dependent decarboxylase, partial [Gemmatimonadota bacterium]
MRDNDSAIIAAGKALPSPAPLRDLLLDAADRGIRYRESLDSRPVAPTKEAVAGLDRFRQPLPATGTDPRAVLALLDEVGSPATVTMAGGRYFGFVNGSSLPVTVASNWLATAWDQNCALHVMSPAVAVIEEVALRWTLDALRLPPGCGGALVTGATIANFTALAAARHAVLERAGWDVDNDGLFGAPPITVVVGEEVHATITRVLGLLGLGRTRTVAVPVDGQGRIRPVALPVINGPTIVCIQAGNVNTGAFDPAREICDWAHAGGAWVHVDGAF